MTVCVQANIQACNTLHVQMSTTDMLARHILTAMQDHVQQLPCQELVIRLCNEL